jgi:Spy/CpxP family protein refolding chaperone
MKKIIVASIAIFMVTLQLTAQPSTNNQVYGKQDATSHKEGRFRKMGHYLNLNDEQQKQAKVINDNYHKKLTALKNNDNLTMGDYKKQSAALEKERKHKMQAILTPEQKNALAEHKQHLKQVSQQRSAQRLEKMKTHLNLSNEQAAKIKEQQEQFSNKATTIRKNEALNKEQKREQLRSLAKEQKEKIKLVLTKEQLQKMEAKKNERKRNNEIGAK